MTTTAQTQAILLLTAQFSKPRDADVKPLAVKEWGRFAFWLRERQLTPDQLLTGHLPELLDGWNDNAVTADRVQRLLDRRAALGFAMEKWERAGLWVLTRADADYPRRWKQRLSIDSPAVLFGCGNAGLLNRGGVAVIGSRNAQHEDLEFCRLVGRLAAQQRCCLVSGGARGVDETAMLAAAANEGGVVGILADGLLRAAISSKYREHLLSSQLALVSPFQPEAGFNVGNAMARNKYIYCLADAAVVAVSGTHGGTWNGALENLRHRWVPLWVKRTISQNSGNAEIVRRGASWLSDNVSELDLSSLSTPAKVPVERKTSEQLMLAETGSYDVVAHSEDTNVGAASGQATATESSDGPPSPAVAQEPQSTVEPLPIPPKATALSEPAPASFYDLFLQRAESLCRDVPRSADELAEALVLERKQVQAWLKRAVADKRVRKLPRPVRYQWQDADSQQKPIFEK